MRNLLKSLLAVILILVLGFAFDTVTFGQSADKALGQIKKINTKGNLVNGGFAAESQQYIFYSNTDIGFAAIKKDGGKTKVISKYKASNINVVGNYIYCSLLEGKSDYNIGFYRMKMDGTDLKKITSSYIDRVNVFNGWIYFLESHQLYKMKIDGTSKNLLVSENVDWFCIENNYIYYNVYDCMYKIDMNGKKKKILATNVNSQFATSEDSFVYYICNLIKDPQTGEYKSGIFKIGKDDKISPVVYRRSSTDYINAFNGWIYYSDSKDIMRIKADGTKAEKICTNAFNVRYDINICGDFIFYSTQFYRNKIKFYKISIDGSGKVEMNPDIKVTKVQEGLASFNECGASINYPGSWELVEVDSPFLKASFYPTRDNNEDVFVSLINPKANFSIDDTILDIQKYYVDTSLYNEHNVIDENVIETTENKTEILKFSSHVSNKNSGKDYNTIVIIKNGSSIVGVSYYAKTFDLKQKYEGIFSSMVKSLKFD